MRRVKIKPFFLIFASFILLAFLVRIFQARELFFWNIDEDLFGFTAKRILVDQRPVLIGYPIPGGIYTGPLFPYILALWYGIARMNPFNLPILAALLGTVTTFLVYIVGKKICASKLVGVVAAVFFAFAFLVNIYSRVLTELTLVPLLALLVYLILYQNITPVPESPAIDDGDERKSFWGFRYGVSDFKTKKPRLLSRGVLTKHKPKHLLLLGMVLVVAVQNEGSSLSLLALVVVSWLIFRFPVPRATLVRVGMLFAAFHLSLVFFDLRHDFFLLKSFLNFFSVKSPAAVFSFSTLSNTFQVFPAAVSRFLVISGQNDIAAQILPCADLVAARTAAIPPVLFWLAVGIIGYFIVRTLFIKPKEAGPKIIFIHLMIMFGGIFAYNIFLGNWFYEWLLVIFFPGIAIILALMMKDLMDLGKWGRLIGLVFLVGFLFLNLLPLVSATSRFGLAARSRAVKAALTEIGDKPFGLDSIGSCFAQGYNYLFWYFGNFPVQSYSDEQMVPTYYLHSGSQKPEVGVVMVNPSQVESQSFWETRAEYLSKTLVRKQVGEIEILITHLGTGSD